MARHYGFLPRACRSYRPKTGDKVERPFSCIGQGFFPVRSFRNLDDPATRFIKARAAFQRRAASECAWISSGASCAMNAADRLGVAGQVQAV